MIHRYNRNQTIMAIICFLGGSLCCALTWLFFRYVPAFSARQFGFNWSVGISKAVAAVCWMAIILSGYRTWRAGGGLHGYHESGFYHDLEAVSGGAVMMGQYAHRITGTAHVLSQLFLAGPLLLLRAKTLVASRLPDNSQLETDLSNTLEILRAANKWQAITDYPELTKNILYLAQMGLIDFSAAKGVPRIKADCSKPSFTH